MRSRERLAEGFRLNRRELTTYLTRMVVREDIAEELVQQCALRALETESIPGDAKELRAWMFSVATNLAIDYLRKHSMWREDMLGDTRSRAIADAGFVAESKILAGSTEMKSIAKDHLAVCFACTLRNLSPQESSALLLREVYDFTVEETASVMGVTFGPVKAWIQSARDAHRAVRRELRARRQAGSVLSVRRARSVLRRARGRPARGNEARRGRKARRLARQARRAPRAVAPQDDADRR